MADQTAIVQELYNRVGTLPPDKAAIVTELARRLGVERVPDATARSLSSATAANGDAMQETPGFLSGLWDETAGTISRMAANDAQVLQHPVDALKRASADAAAILQSQGTVGAEALDSFKRGDVARGVRHGLAYAVPLLGPQIDNIANEGETNLPHALGRATGFGLLNSVPESPYVHAGVRAGVGATVDAVKKAPAKAVGTVIRPNLDATEAAQVQYGRDNAVPMRLSTQTGSKVALGAEKLASHLPLMDTVADEARAAERAGIQAAGSREVAALNPDAPEGTTPPKPLEVGEAIHQSSVENVATHKAATDDAYSMLRSIEGQPQFRRQVQTGTELRPTGVVNPDGSPAMQRVPVVEDIQAPVDYRQIKAAVKPLLAEQLRPMSITQEQASTGIKAMRNILDAPDFVPASVADQDLGALKRIIRESPQSQSVAKASFMSKLLSKQIDAVVGEMGPDAVAALQRGRESRVAQANAEDFQQAIGFRNVGTNSAEPGSAVELVSKLTAPNDRNIALLRQVKEQTPEHIPALAQASVQSLIDNATAEAGMSTEKTALRKFNAQGAETKRILYGEAAGRIGDFFGLNERLARNPNPSGTGPVLALVKGGAVLAGAFTAPVSTAATVGGYVLGAKPLARMLFNPETSRLMQTALKTPANSKGASILASQLTKAAKAAGADLAPVAPPAAAAASAANPASADTFVTVPGEPGNAYGAKYKVVEQSSLQASHSGKNFNPNPNYKLQNDRDYTNALNQGPVLGWSSRAEFDPKQLINDNPDSVNGPAVIDSKGNVLGGNGRVMITERVYSDTQHPGIAAYRQLLEQKAHQFGIDPKSFTDVKQPVLVREVPDAEFAGRTKQQAISDFNKTGTKALTPSEKAIRDSNRVSPGTLEHVAAQLEKHGPDATVSDILDGEHGKNILNRLIDDGVLTTQERGAYENEDGLTPDGRDRISALMAGRFFKDPKVLDSIAPKIRNQVTRVAAPLAQVQGRGEWNLTPDMQEAVDILHQAQALGIKNVSDFIAQDGLFGKQKYSQRAQVLAEAVQKLKADELVAAARQYAGDANFAVGGDSLFGAAPTPEASFADSFEAALKARAAEKKNALAPAADKSGKRKNSLAK